jgi:peptidoglycan/LPS O-acetylase OafA/YrhL
MFNNALDFILIPPAWSLGAEIQFYLVLPFLLLFNFRKIAITLSLSVFVAATFGIIHSDWFGFRLLPGILFMFLLGSLLYDRHQSSEYGVYGKRLFYSVMAMVVVLSGLLIYSNKILLLYNRETLIGLIVGFFFLNLLARRARNSLDEAIGNLSYGVFLNHFFVKWAFFGEEVEGFFPVVAYLVLSLFIAFVMSHLVEIPILNFRKKLRMVKAEPVPATS